MCATRAIGNAPRPSASPRPSLTQCFAEKRVGMSTKDPILGTELDGVELPGTLQRAPWTHSPRPLPQPQTAALPDMTGSCHPSSEPEDRSPLQTSGTPPQKLQA